MDGEESLRPGNGNLSAGRGETHRLAALTVYAVLSVIVVFPVRSLLSRVFGNAAASNVLFQLKNQAEQEERILSIISVTCETWSSVSGISECRRQPRAMCIGTRLRLRLERVRWVVRCAQLSIVVKYDGSKHECFLALHLGDVHRGSRKFSNAHRRKSLRRT